MPSAHDPDVSGRVSLDVQVDRLCDQYEAAWRCGQQPRLEDYLTRVQGSGRDELLQQLLALDLELRRDSGESPAAAEYLARFPGYPQQVEAAFARAPASSPPASGSMAVDESQSRRRAPHIRCPHCRHPIELLDDRPLAEMTCPSCGSRFTLATGATVDATVPLRSASTPPVLGPSDRLALRPRYEVLEEVGRGGMGVVYRARHKLLDRHVAIKITLRGASPERFLREARILANIRSPHVVTVYDFDLLSDDRPMLVMEWVEGTTLSRLIRSPGGPLAEERVLTWMQHTCQGMYAAAEQGIIHRDLKPSNLLIDSQGHARVADFGLARGPAGLDGLSLTDNVMGTPYYMAPEQVNDSSHVDIRADLYSLGCTVYHLLAGQPPYGPPRHTTLAAKLVAHATEPFPALADIRDDIPDDLQRILSRLVAKRPADRFSQPTEAAHDLAPFSAGANLAALLSTPAGSALPSTASHALTPPRQARRRRGWPNRRQVLLGAAAGGAALAVGTAVWVLIHSPPIDDVVVRKSTLFVRRRGDDQTIERITLTDHPQDNPLAEHPLRGTDDFKLRAELSRAAHWCLVWLDTRGQVQIATRSEKPESVVEFPAGDHMVGVDPQDPPGLHLLLLVATDGPARDIEAELQSRLGQLGKPRGVPADRLVATRGAGQVNPTAVHLDPAYFERLEARLPGTVRWVQQLYLPTQR